MSEALSEGQSNSCLLEYYLCLLDSYEASFENCYRCPACETLWCFDDNNLVYLWHILEVDLDECINKHFIVKEDILKGGKTYM